MIDDIKICFYFILNKCILKKKKWYILNIFECFCFNNFCYFFFIEYVFLFLNRVKVIFVSVIVINVTWDVSCCYVFVYIVYYKCVSFDIKGWYVEVT